MSTPKRFRVPKLRSFNRVGQLPKQFMAWLLRLVFIGARFSRTRQAGFVLPTTVLLILIVSLTVGGLSFRSFSRAERTIALREQQIVDEIAAPAIDRARAKIEYLLANDGRVADKRPPSSNDLIEALLDNAGDPDNDPYTLPDETQLDVVPGNIAPTVNTTGLEPAWAFDFQGRTVVYSILVKSDVDTDGDGTADITMQSKADADGDGVNEKVEAQITRNGPISAGDPGGSCPIGTLAGSGWYQIGNGARLEKNIQVNVLASGGTAANRSVNAAEYQQVRVAQRGSRWGAWFRYDLDIFPGSDFRWNGAMHTEGNLITGQSFKAYLVSSQGSCINDPLSSEISLNSIDNNEDGDTDDPGDFRGELIGGSMLRDTFELEWGNNGTSVDYHSSQAFGGGGIPNITELDDGAGVTDSLRDSVDTTDDPSDISSDPISIFTKDESSHLTPGNYRDANWGTTATNFNQNGRVELDQPDATRPFLDDGYRADSRYGPKFRYDSSQALDEQDGSPIAANLSGDDIPLSHDALVVDEPDNEIFGLDGYWERRSISQGLRVIVGQRLELGNALGWGGSDDPLYPQQTVEGSIIDGSTPAQEPGEVLQQRSLRDNLAAVQGMVVYHYTQGTNGELPYMCMASTAHPGTDKTVENSRTFTPYPSSSAWKIDFLNGVGTNGWEFDFLNKYATPTSFATEVASTQPLGKALRNLAYFAGDPLGGAPSFPAVQGTENIAFTGSNAATANLVHPYPYLSMWGDFSILRRIFDDYLDAGTAYTDLSPADQSVLHSAACSLGMLAYNIKSVEDEVSAGSTDPALLELNEQILRDRTFGFNTGTVGTLATTVKYPALYYVFPVVDHDHIGSGSTAVQPLTEEYFSEDLPGIDTPYIVQTSGGAITGGINDVADRYKIVAPADISLTPLDPASTFEQPVAAVATDPDTSTAPSFTDTAAYLTTGQRNRLYFSKNYINADGTYYATTFLDKGMMDGRELMAARITDIDIGNLTLNNVAASGIKWIPERGGIVYAFREDAVREDSIIRPKHTNAIWNDDVTVTAKNCRVLDTLLTDADCYMDYVPEATNGGSQRGTFDPPLNPTTGISVKPVDLVADPMRRPNGFRIFNGANLNRSDDIEAAGMTLVTDNPLYIKGDLNLHETKTGIAQELQEFTGGSFLNDADFATANEGTAQTNFYGRVAADLDNRFANPAEDSWRPVEIFADAITILSDTYLDGVVEDAFVKRRGTGQGQPIINSSFTNFHRPRSSSDIPRNQWEREDQLAVGSNDPDLPIRFDRNGVLTRNNAPYPDGAGNDTSYIYFDYESDVRDYREQRRSEAVTADLDGNATRVNALLITGIVPSRPEQPYGGLHNFPRLLEFWRNQPLYISGGFFQLNFSTQATAPYDQDAWSPGDTSNSDLFIGYYDAAVRIWGYDVALQYVSAAPIAERFITLGRPRNEYYRELDLEDDYIKPLRCPTREGGRNEANYIQVDPRFATLAECEASL